MPQSAIDNVAIDYVLPAAQIGPKLIEAARRIWQTLQISTVYCTALADLETLKAVMTTESYGYVVKPFHSKAVRAAIELVLDRREKELRHLPGA